MIPLFVVSYACVAEAAAEEWLSRIDAAAHIEDAHIVLDVEVTDPRGEVSKRTLEIWQKGSDRRLARFVEPARLKGVGLLVPGPDQLYLYLPAYGKPRRVVGSQRSDAFLGTDFSIEDLARVRFEGQYDVTSTTAGAGGTTELVLVPKTDAGMASLLVRVGANDLVERIEHRDTAGKATRILEMTDVRVVGQRHLAHRLEVTDVVKGSKTVATIREVQLDGGLSDELFTITSLTRP